MLKKDRAVISAFFLAVILFRGGNLSRPPDATQVIAVTVKWREHGSTRGSLGPPIQKKMERF